MTMKNKKILLLFLSVVTIMLCCACSNGKDSDSGKEPVKEPEQKTETVDVMVDWKDLEDPRGKYPEAGTQTGETKPQLVETKYETKDAVVADIVPTEMGYAVDPTGATDSTEGIQQALYDCYYAGGGTVFLPAGNYAVTDTLIIPQCVTLRGDWQDPDVGTEYGTVISAWMDSSEQTTGGLFLLSDVSGVVGMTVYYPFQTLYEVLPYPFTFYVAETSQVVTIRNVTVINGYRGIGTKVEASHEILIVDNLKGTFLSSGMELNNQSDAGTVDSVYISSKYWKEAAAEYMNKPVGEELDKYVKQKAIGMIISDIEWTTFGNINIDGYSIGMKIVPGYRIDFVGALIDVNLTDCGVGILSQGIDERWGVVMARSNIENDVINEWIGMIKMSGVTIGGKVEETREGTIVQQPADLSAYPMDYDRSYQKPASNFVVATLKKGLAGDVSATLQQYLNEMGQKGGGVVYVPPGTYKFDNPITIPAGVELRGSSSVAQREVNQAGFPGTRFMCYYGDDATNNAEKDKAFITLAGKNAGVNGIRIIYPENGAVSENINTTYAVRGTADGIYFVNSFIAAAAYGVDMRNCDNHFIQGNYTGCYYNSYRLGGKNGMLRGCLHNPTMIGRINVEGLEDWGEASKSRVQITNPITRRYLQHIIVDHAENELIYCMFAYGAKNLLVNESSENTVVTNVGSDNLNALGAQFVNKNGSLTVINALRFNGHTYDNENGDIKIFNPIAADEADLEHNVILSERK